MNNIMLGNSSAAYEPLVHFEVISTSFARRSTDEIQSSSVTSSGHLWQLSWANIKNANLLLASSPKLDIEAISRNAERIQRHLALVQLLESWSGEDEEEQRETWQHLKKLLDDDRLSDRKLFP